MLSLGESLGQGSGVYAERAGVYDQRLGVYAERAGVYDEDREWSSA